MFYLSCYKTVIFNSLISRQIPYLNYSNLSGHETNPRIQLKSCLSHDSWFSWISGFRMMNRIRPWIHDKTKKSPTKNSSKIYIEPWLIHIFMSVQFCKHFRVLIQLKILKKAKLKTTTTVEMVR